MKITIKTRVANATVRIDKLGGQGVLVPGHSLLIATHCIRWDGAGGMTLGDHFIETVTTRSGTKLRVGPLAAEPVSDMAVPGALDDQEFYRESNAFEQWCDTTDAVPLT